MTDVHEIVKGVESSDLFKKFSKDNPDHYLVHVFCHVKQGEVVPELGYYGEETDKITVFTTDPITARPPEEALKESGTLRRLDLDALKTGLSDARKIAADYLTEKHPGHPLMQEICILQQADVPIWNITLVLASLNMLNLRIQGDTGEISYDEMRNIMDLRQRGT